MLFWLSLRRMHRLMTQMFHATRPESGWEETELIECPCWDFKSHVFVISGGLIDCSPRLVRCVCSHLKKAEVKMWNCTIICCSLDFLLGLMTDLQNLQWIEQYHGMFFFLELLFTVDNNLERFVFSWPYLGKSFQDNSRVVCDELLCATYRAPVTPGTPLLLNTLCG